MRLQLRGIFASGTTMLDRGITDLRAVVIDGTVHLYSTTGRQGGIVDYLVGANGAAAAVKSMIFAPTIAGIVGNDLVLTNAGGALSLLVAVQGQSMIGFGLGASGLAGQITLTLNETQNRAIAGAQGYLDALVCIADSGASLFPGGFNCSQVIDLVDATISGQTFVLATCTATNGVTAFARNAATGMLTQTGHAGAATGIGISAPTALEIVSIDGQTFVLVAASATSSISVMRLTASGALIPTDHVMDTGATRFAGAQALAVARVGDHVFVVAGGSDDGLTLFTLLPDGTLIALDTIADGATTAMNKVTSITTAVNGTLLHVFVGSQNDTGITQFTIDLASLGLRQRGTANADVLSGGALADILMANDANDTLNGGGGDDVLVSGTGVTTMTGGTGRDVFVVRSDAVRVVITDFNRLEDRLDLSDLPMLRSVGQLQVTTTAQGAIIVYRDVTIEIRSHNNQPLSLADLFPGGFAWADRFPVDLGAAPPVGVAVTGTLGPDVLTGSDGPDTLRGDGGNDTLDGGGGDDVLFGDDGNDTLHGGAGNDTIRGGAGDDVLFGDDGDDKLYGGDGNDLIWGGAGNDLISGSDGDDTLHGGTGNDTIQGGRGADLIYGDDGDDSLNGGNGDDTIHGGNGNDRIIGSNGDDSLTGGAGNDTIYGGKGHDQIWGGDDVDLIYGDNGRDTIYGGDGNDTIHGGMGHDRIYGEDGDDSLLGGSGDDVIDGGNGNDTIYGENGHDRLFGGNGDDLIRGGDGDDTITGGPDHDTLWGGSGADVFQFFRNTGSGRIMDFNPGEGDRLRLDDWIWNDIGTLSSQQVVDRFGMMDAAGNVVLDFTDLGGGLIVLDGFTNLSGLASAIDVF